VRRTSADARTKPFWAFGARRCRKTTVFLQGPAKALREIFFIKLLSYKYLISKMILLPQQARWLGTAEKLPDWKLRDRAG
jgi:hypothetical protein